MVRWKSNSAWAAIWPMFGAANQLVAALALLAVGVWVVKGLKKDNSFLMIPMWFMLATTVAALLFMIKEKLTGVPNYLLVSISIILLVLAILMVRESFRALKVKDESKA